MLIGEYESKLGEKNRVAVPKKFRSELKGNVIITRGYENCLILVDTDRWKELVKSLEIRPLLSASVRDLKRFLVGGAYEVDFDNQGRFVLSQALIEFASLSNEVVFVGIENWIEIWSKDKWLEKITKLATEVEDIAERLTNLDD